MVNITNLITHCECFTDSGERGLNTHLRQRTDILMVLLLLRSFRVKTRTLINACSGLDFRRLLPQRLPPLEHDVAQAALGAVANFLSFVLFHSFFTWSRNSKRHLTTSLHTLFTWTGFHHLLICIYCKSVCTSVVLHGTPRGVCSVCSSPLQLFFLSFLPHLLTSTPPSKPSH